ncbi:MAG: hypothetical protein IK075_05285 [Prevotella sp.]|nr:hypothetical protein [Prevotella sp.]
MKRLFWGIFITLILTGLSSCVFDTVYVIHVTNHTNDTILIGYGGYNTIDSTMMFLPSAPWDTLTSDSDTITSARVYSHRWITPNGDSLFFYCIDTKINGNDKLSIGRHDLVPPDSTASYHQSYYPLFQFDQDQKGYFFVITLETARNHTWEEICRDTLYNRIIITQEMQKQGRYYDYWGKDSLSVRPKEKGDF